MHFSAIALAAMGARRAEQTGNSESAGRLARASTVAGKHACRRTNRASVSDSASGVSTSGTPACALTPTGPAVGFTTMTSGTENTNR